MGFYDHAPSGLPSARLALRRPGGNELNRERCVREDPSQLKRAPNRPASVNLLLAATKQRQIIIIMIIIIIIIIKINPLLPNKERD